MLTLTVPQPPEAPAWPKHEALVTLAKYRADLEKCPDDKNGNWHEAATTAWCAMLTFESMVSQLLGMRSDAPSQAARDALEYAIDQLVEAAGTVTSEAERRAEDDRLNGAFWREVAAANERRDF